MGATLLALGAAAAAIPAAARAAGPQPGHRDLGAASPDAGDAVSAYLTARGWLNTFDPPPVDQPPARIPLPHASGVCVLLRQAGRLVGTGVDAGGDDLMVRRALGRALSEVLGDAAVVNLPEDLRTSVGRALTLELEVAGPPVPLLGTTFADVAEQLDPGLDGVAVRRGQGMAMLFPAQMLATNTAGRVERLLPGLAGDLGLAMMPLPELARRFDVSLYRFRTTCLAQRGPRDLPFVVMRGDEVVEESAVTRQGLERLALGLARRLVGAMAPMDEPLGVMGTYRPVPDRYEPLIAPPLEQALAAWALCRFSALPGAEGAPEMAAAADRLLRELEQVVDGEQDPLGSAVVCAAIVHAAIAHPAYLAGGPPPLYAGAVQRLGSAYGADHGFAAAADGTPVSPHGQAMIAAALARLLAAGAPPAGADVTRQAIDSAWASVPQHQQISLLPWIAWAESDYAQATGGPLAGADAMRSMRDLLEASRIGSPDRPGPEDLAGGFALSEHGRLLASSQTVRPACFLAWMVRDPGLTPQRSAAAALGRVLDTGRFVMQLSVRDASSWAYRNPARAAGGIRAAPWDVDQPVAAQAMALVMVVETLESLDAISRRGGG